MIKIENKKSQESKKENFASNDSLDTCGIVLETNYSEAEVLYKDKIEKVKLSQTFNTVCNNTIYTGDKVILNEEKKTIEKIVERKNILCREKHDGTKINSFGITKVIATNIDLAVIVVSAKEPPLHPKFIDRYLIVLESNKIPFIILLNKCDQKNEKEENILEIYRKLGFQVLETSTLSDIGIKELKQLLKGKQAILVGQSGVGKSSLVNTLMQTNNIKTNNVGIKSKKGCHTTTHTKYYKWEEDSAIIDTPGIKSLDIRNFQKEEIQNYFPEIVKAKANCKFKNCLHYKESVEECCVKRRVKDNLITQERYESYLKIIKELSL